MLVQRLLYRQMVCQTFLQLRDQQVAKLVKHLGISQSSCSLFHCSASSVRACSATCQFLGLSSTPSSSMSRSGSTGCNIYCITLTPALPVAYAARWTQLTIRVNPQGQRIIIEDKRQNSIDEISAGLPTEDCLGFCIAETGMVSRSHLLCRLRR